MIHALDFPTKLEKPLLRSTYVQLNILYCATRVSRANKSSCVTELRKIYGADATELATWVFQERDRRQAWQKFAWATGTPDAKRLWLRELKREVKRISRARPEGALKSFTAYTDPWAAPALRYLKAGYIAFRKSSLPTEITGEVVRGYDFIREFRAKNPRVHMCPACDGSRQIDGVKENRLFSSLDHFLPQDHYPHLALHPRNLVPVCVACNSLKSNKDPLAKQGGRRDLKEIVFPYDGLGWKEYTHTKVNRKGPKAAVLADVVADQPGGIFTEDVSVHRDLYRVLNRWNIRSDDIGYRLFRRVRQYFLEADMQYRGQASLPDLQERLDRLLAYCYEDIGTEPDAYPVTWWLATLIQEELTRGWSVAAASAFVGEIELWLNEAQKLHKTFRETGEKVRGRLS